MKKHRCLVAVLTLLAVSLPAFAQQAKEQPFTQEQLGKMDRKLTETVKKSRDNAPKCVRCGRVITEDNQYTKCPQDPDVFCCPETQPKDSRYHSDNPYYKGGDPADPANYKTCQWCKLPITDERYGRRCPKDPDVHCLPAPKDASKDYTCYRCGKSFRPGQHCSAADYNAFCAKDAEQEKALEKAEQERREQAAKASRCPKCGEEYNVDVIYHGDPHHCRK